MGSPDAQKLSISSKNLSQNSMLNMGKEYTPSTSLCSKSPSRSSSSAMPSLILSTSSRNLGSNASARRRKWGSGRFEDESNNVRNARGMHVSLYLSSSLYKLALVCTRTHTHTHTRTHWIRSPDCQGENSSGCFLWLAYFAIVDSESPCISAAMAMVNPMNIKNAGTWIEPLLWSERSAPSFIQEWCDSIWRLCFSRQVLWLPCVAVCVLKLYDNTGHFYCWMY